MIGVGHYCDDHADMNLRFSAELIGTEIYCRIKNAQFKLTYFFSNVSNFILPEPRVKPMISPNASRSNLIVAFSRFK